MLRAQLTNLLLTQALLTPNMRQNNKNRFYPIKTSLKQSELITLGLFFVYFIIKTADFVDCVEIVADILYSAPANVAGLNILAKTANFPSFVDLFQFTLLKI